MKEAGWNFGMGICNAYLGNDLRANSFNDPCKVGALPVGIAVGQKIHRITRGIILQEDQFFYSG